MKFLGMVTMVALALSFPSAAKAAGFNEAANDAFLKDLNAYTAKASRVILFNEIIVADSSKQGPEVHVHARGDMVDFGGILLPAANYVVVGQSCESCPHETKRYSTGGEWDNIIVVYD